MRIRRFNEGRYPKPILNSNAGWVNIKIDNNLKERIAKYVIKLKHKYASSSFEQLIGCLSIDSEDDSKYDKITKINILQYFKEIRDNFDSSASGLIIEQIVAVFLNGKRTETGNKDDIITRDGTSYQIKFYANDTVPVIKGRYLSDYTIFFIKDNENFINMFKITRSQMDIFAKKDQKDRVYKYVVDLDYPVEPVAINVNISERFSLVENSSDIESVYKFLSILQSTIDELLIDDNKESRANRIKLIGRLTNNIKRISDKFE